MQDIFEKYKMASSSMYNTKKDISNVDSKEDSNSVNVSEIYNLNKQFFFYINSCYETNKNADFSPCLEDYLNFIKEIKAKAGVIEKKPTTMQKENPNLTTKCSEPQVPNISIQTETKMPNPSTKFEMPAFNSIFSSSHSISTPISTVSQPAATISSDMPKFSLPSFLPFNSNPPASSTIPAIPSMQWNKVQPVSGPSQSFPPFSFDSKNSQFQPITTTSTSFSPSNYTPSFSVSNILPVESNETKKDSLGFTLPNVATTFATSPDFTFSNMSAIGNKPNIPEVTTPTFSMPQFSSSFPPKCPSPLKFPFDTKQTSTSSTHANPFGMSNPTGLNTFTASPGNTSINFSSVFSQPNYPVKQDSAFPSKGSSSEQMSPSKEDMQAEPASNLGYEPDALFSCYSKLYVKENRNFRELGVGIFNIKILKEDEKHLQLIFRLESSRSGNILMNIKIEKKSKSFSRTTVTDLFIFSKPNPPISEVIHGEFKSESEVVTYLVRIKASSDLDKILEILN